MTELAYKTQANRLAEHLSRVHGVKLKRSSLLEAIAALHGQADWNTLLAAGPAPVELTGAPRAAAAPRISIAASSTGAFDSLMTKLVAHRSTGAQFQPSAGGFKALVAWDGVRSPWGQASDEELGAFVAELKRLAGLQGSEEEGSQEGHFEWTHARAQWQVRVFAVKMIGGGHSVLARWVNQSEAPMRLDDLGLTRLDEWRKGITLSQGLCLVAGPTSSGCRTTLESSAADLLSRGRTVFDYRALREQSGALDRAARMRVVLRSDYDAVLFGDIRCPESAAEAVQFAEAGIEVLASIHAPNVAGALARLGDQGVSEGTTQSVVRACLAQGLVRRSCPVCSAAGCSLCRNTGYVGRTMVSECVVASHRSTIAQQLSPKVRSAPTMLDDAVAKCLAGVTDVREISRIFGTEAEEVLAHAIERSARAQPLK